MKVVVDTNILFSAVLKPESEIARILVMSDSRIEFYSCYFLKEELNKHVPKLARLTGLTKEDIWSIFQLLCDDIVFVDEAFIRIEYRKQSLLLLAEGDQKDAPFVALCLSLDAKLWTGDKRLARVLDKQGMAIAIDTSSLLAFINYD